MTRMTRWGMTTVSATVLVVAVVGLAPAQDKPRPLYDRLGGVYSIATVVDEFVERLLVNHTLNANPAINHARSRVPKAGLKFQVTALVCAATGGPCRYTGRAMRESHQQLNITEEQWQAMVAEFRKTLDNFKVPAREQGELITIVNSTKADIVARAARQQ